MRRELVLSIVGLGLASLSCDLVGGPLGFGALPSVDAPPPQDAGGPALRVTATSQLDEASARIHEYLETRHTLLSARERVLLARTVVEEARRHDLEPELVLAVIHVESGGNNVALSPAGAMGLMQLLPSTGKQLAANLGIPWGGPDTLLDPVVNVKLGTAYLRELADRYDSIQVALAAYNWGPGRIDRKLRAGAGVPKLYVQQVMRAYGEESSSDRARRS